MGRSKGVTTGMPLVLEAAANYARRRRAWVGLAHSSADVLAALGRAIMGSQHVAVGLALVHETATNRIWRRGARIRLTNTGSEIGTALGTAMFRGEMQAYLLLLVLDATTYGFNARRLARIRIASPGAEAGAVLRAASLGVQHRATGPIFVREAATHVLARATLVARIREARASVQRSAVVRDAIVRADVLADHLFFVGEATAWRGCVVLAGYVAFEHVLAVGLANCDSTTAGVNTEVLIVGARRTAKIRAPAAVRSGHERANADIVDAHTESCRRSDVAGAQPEPAFCGAAGLAHDAYRPAHRVVVCARGMAIVYFRDGTTSGKAEKERSEQREPGPTTSGELTIFHAVSSAPGSTVSGRLFPCAATVSQPASFGRRPLAERVQSPAL